MARPKKTEPQKSEQIKQKQTEEKLAPQKKTEPKKIEPLTGESLLNKVKELETLTKEEKAKMCGYYTVNKNGIERVTMMQFLNALIDAEGIELDGQGKAEGRGGRSASYRTSVQSNGQLLIGSTYTKQLGLHPGDEFEIALGRKHIHLKPVGNHLEVGEVVTSQ